MLGANITEVWNCVITNDAPIAPMASRKKQKRPVIVRQPDAHDRKRAQRQQPCVCSARTDRSHSQPIRTRTRMVIATAAIAELPICSLVRWSSVRIIGINGANPNHPKKHRKNASHVMWKARIGAL